MGEYELLRIQLLKTLLQMEETLLTDINKENIQSNVTAEFRDDNVAFQKDNIQVKAVLSVQELSEYLGVSTDCIYTMVRENQIPFLRIRRRILFYRESINSWIHTTPKKPM
ncbi:helix-turn-helix domain-containing protein [Paenibacillus sp. 2TAB23]|uniref:helix-turn-helix domain-containing protein n=1 Tax=Paenibacillus sp. 2TAB23 TaxID=3233004 RepID=UPI003F9C9D19